jgi:transposase-like protein
MEAVKLSFEPGKTAAEVARELDIPVTRLYKWREQFEKKQDKPVLLNTNMNIPNILTVNNQIPEMKEKLPPISKIILEKQMLKNILKYK